MRILLAGFGLIGKQRFEVIKKSALVKEIFILDPKVTDASSMDPRCQLVDVNTARGLKVDGTIVATPHDVAVELLPAFAKNTKNLIVEKPLGRNGAEAAELANAFTETGSSLYVGFNYRYLKNIQKLQALVASGELGALLGGDCVLAHGAQPGYEKSWKTDFNQCGGGAGIDPGVHLFDLLVWLFGDVSVGGGLLSRTYWNVNVEDHATLLFSVQGKSVVSANISISSWQSRFEMNLEFEKMQVRLLGRGKFYGPQQLILIHKWPWLQPEVPRETLFDFGSEDSSIKDQTEDFLAVCAGKPVSSNLCTLSQAMKVMSLVDGCYALPQIGKLVKK